jgi:hypothetical protein
MKKVKLFEGFLNEKFRFSGTCSNELCTLIPSLEKIGDLISTYSESHDLIKIQAETSKFQKEIQDRIRTSAAGATDELDWDRGPKAPIFVLNLKQRYPQHEAKYYELWYKAAERQPVFSYGGAIAIFKTYCKRENLLLEDHDYDNELTEEQINTL